MTSFLKKLQLLKKRDNSDSNPEVNHGQGGWDNQEAHFSGFQPPASNSPATQRTSQLLPLLMKPSQAPAEIKKKVQPQTVALPDLVQRQTTKSPTVAARIDNKQGTKEPTSLPRLFERERAQKGSTPQGKKRTPDMPLYPELSDERFRTLWDSKRPLRGRSIKEILDMMDEREILDTILEQLRPPFQQASTDSKQPKRKLNSVSTDGSPTIQKPVAQPRTSHPLSLEKIRLYKYYGVKLRNSRHKDVVSEYLHMLLNLSAQEETDREGISEAIGVVAFCHLSEILVALRDFGHFMQAKKSSLVEAMPEESWNLSERQTRTNLILCYGQAAMGAQPEDMLSLIDYIVSEILFQFTTTNKDEAMKKAFLRAVIMISKALLHSKRQDINIPHKAELVVCIIDVIEDEPVGSFSVMVLHQAIITVTCMSNLKPLLDSAVRSKLVNKSIQKVFSLPALKMTKVKAGSPTQLAQTQDFYQQTVTACNSMLTSLLSEAPNLESLQDILIHTNTWIDSPKNYERERAIKSTSHLLKFVSQHLDFDTTAEFFLLGQLVGSLALHIADSIKEIGQIAAEATYHLHYIIMSKMAKEMEKKRKNKKGNIVKWLREDFFISGPTIFYNNISKVAKAFGEHLSPSQITELVLKAIRSLVHEDKNISQAAGLLLSSFLEECGMDLEELPMIVKEIYNHLPKVTNPATREEMLKSVCHLASKRLNGVVDILLECSVECDESASELWRALVADPYSNIKIMRPLLKRLQDEDPVLEASSRRNSKSVMPIAATHALCFILSLPDASDSLQNKFPNLLIALVTQIYFVIGTGKRGSKRASAISENSEQPNALRTAVQALKNLIVCAGYTREYNILDTIGCWDMLSSPDTYFDGILHLIRTLFMLSKVHLKMMFKQANTYLRRLDPKERTIGMAFFTELLYHHETGLFFMKQDILDVLQEWMMQPYPLMQVLSIKGLGYLLQQPLENEILEPVFIPLINCASEPDRGIAKESIKALQYMFRHLEVELYGFKATGLIPHLSKYFSDEDYELRYFSINLFGILLKGVKEIHRSTVTEDVLQSLVPLFIQLTDDLTREIAKDTLNSCASYMNWVDMPSTLFDYETYASLNNMYLNICQFIVSKHKEKFHKMLVQMLNYLKSRNACYRETAAILIACSAQYMKPDVVTAKQVEEVYLALQDLQGDCEASVAKVAVESMEEVFRHCGHRINPNLVPSQLLTTLARNISKQSSESKQ
ncbi:maestro heat-like repeat-containing protein family member 7 [Candoia aspera]|uniref:maestro heat-like repeat-containing protein family member 7 n=1 Tax=Candoia aspera TaxID=51853 RepID=UPI002FD81004